MNKSTQKEAVFHAVVNVIGHTPEPGTKVSAIMSKEQRSNVNAILFEGFKAGSIELDTTFANDSDLKAYVSGLQSNWLRKDKRLNGGGTYVPVNKGSRTGMGDPQLKALRALLSTKSEPKERAEIQKFIEARQAEIQAARAPKVSIDVSALPAALRKYA